MLLAGKTGVIFGVANKRSIAHACAMAASRAGAKLVLTYQNERLAAGVGKLADGMPGEVDIVPCDVTDDASIDQAVASIGELMPRVDFVIHSVAFARREELEGSFRETTREGWREAMDVSAFSLAAVSRGLAPLMTEGGSIVTMSYLGADRVLPHYNVMGPAKAALEASVRYLASGLGGDDIRVNAVSAGPLRTLAASGIAGFNQILDVAAERSPLKRNATQDDVADATVFLVSDMSRSVTGTTMFVDCGFHIMAL